MIQKEYIGMSTFAINSNPMWVCHHCDSVA